MRCVISILLFLTALNIFQLHAAETTNATPSPTASVSIPIEFVRGRVMVPVRVNDSKPLSFMLDTGYGITMVHPDLIETLGLKKVGKITIVGIAGEEEAGTYEGAVFDFAGYSYSPRRVASLPSEAQSRRRRDGILGAGVFRRFVVEIDSPKKTLRLHDPKTFAYAGHGEIIPLEFSNDLPVIDATIIAPDGKPVRGKFEIDTGCDDAICLGKDFIESNQLSSRTNNANGGVKTGVGGEARIHSGHVPQLQLGRFKVDKPATSFFLDGSPTDKKFAGHIGMSALQKFKVIFDYSRRQMILEATDK